MAQNVVFRRINGRIIPIKVTKKDVKEVGKGVAIAGAGVGVGAAAGVTSAALDLRHFKTASMARSAEQRATRLGSKGKFRLAAKHMRKADEIMARSLRADKFGTNVKKIGLAASAGVIAAGISHALNQTRLKDHPKTKEFASTAGGLASAFAVKTVYDTRKYHDVGAFGAVKKAAKIALKKGIRFL